MNIKPFAVEEWMNAYEDGARYNIAETCVDSVSLDELFALCGEDRQADGILGQEEAEGAGLALSVVNSVGSGIRSLAVGGSGGTSPAQLLARYEEAVRAGAKPAEGHPVEPAAPNDVDPDGNVPSDNMDSWRRSARLAIEQNRFI